MSTGAGVHAPRRIVGIHGINQHRYDHKVLADRWKAAVSAGLRAAGAASDALQWTFELVYFAADVRPSAIAGSFKGFETDALELELLLAWLQATAEQQPDGGGGAVKGNLAVPPVPRSVQGVAQHLVAQPGMQFLGVEGVRRLARDLHLYLTDGAVRTAVQRSVDAVVADAPVDVLLGHSMGSVVAYEWCARARPGAVTTMVTFGSPLGIAPVLSRLRPPPTLPHEVRQPSTWVNAASEHDPVAWPKLLSGVFGSHVRDVVAPGRVDAHGMRTYLESAVMGRVLSQALRLPHPEDARGAGEGRRP